MLTGDRCAVKRLFTSLIGTVWTVCTNIMARALKMPINCLRINSVVPKRVPTKGEQCIERQDLLKVVYRRHLSEAVGRYELVRERL